MNEARPQTQPMDEEKVKTQGMVEGANTGNPHDDLGSSIDVHKRLHVQHLRVSVITSTKCCVQAE